MKAIRTFPILRSRTSRRCRSDRREERASSAGCTIPYRHGTVSRPMLKISRLTDYGLLAAVYLARHAGQVVAAREISEFYHLPLPAVTKVLKSLLQGGIISSHRGVGGGYSFDGDPETVTLGQVIEILEGPWDLVECETTDDHGHATCAIRVACPSRRFM